MRIDALLIFLLLLGFSSCRQSAKNEISKILGIDQTTEWILVIHPEGCKTCLDSFYTDLLDLPSNSGGVIVLLNKNSKSLRLHPIIEHTRIPLFLDQNKILLQKGILEPTDQILIFRENKVEKFNILNYQEALDNLGIN